MVTYFGSCWDALLILRNALLLVVESELKRVYGEEGWWKNGIAPRFDKTRQEQLRLLFEERRQNVLLPLSGEQKEILDLSDLYKVIEGEWAKVFRIRFKKNPLSWLKEILDMRNPLAHPAGAGIDRDMAKRLLQNCRFVLQLVDAEAADHVHRIEVNLDRPTPNDVLSPWYAVATPHEDIRQGRLAEAVFAANLWAVVQDTAPHVYVDPEEFYRKTYMTDGLATVLKRVGAVLRVGGEVGDRIISLQTAFGGGKTHTLVALWHLAKHGPVLRESPSASQLQGILGDNIPTKPRAVAVFTNQTCDATQGRLTSEGVHTHTLWGELALQLGGATLYERIRANDEARRVPQGIFVEILRECAPCLILLDELADYCVGAAAVSVGETTLADQTVSFIQQLTEAVDQVPGSVVVATLPASKYEVALSEKGHEAFDILEKRFQRLGADVKPVADDEIYEVVRARLFESIAPENDPEAPERVAQAYEKLYSAHAGEVPAEAAKKTYAKQIARAYPFHPLLIDAFYTRWGSNPDFQRTRGVLRLLAAVVSDLWRRRQASTETQHMIQPCHLNWSGDALQASLTRLWGPAYQSVAAADVLGNKSNAAVFDEERGGDYSRESIAQGLASAMLLGSFGAGGGRSGFSSKDLKLACSKVGLNWNYADGALLELESRCFFLHTTSAGSLGKRYWFGTKPNLNHLVVQYRQQTTGVNFDEQIVEDLRRESQKAIGGASTWRVIVDPGRDLPEQKSLTLLILSPGISWNDGNGALEAARARVLEISAKCGERDRYYRNTLLFLLPTGRGAGRLRQAHRDFAALEGVLRDYGDQLDDEQKSDLKKRLEAARENRAAQLGPAYTAALRVQGQDVEVCSLTDARKDWHDHLGYLWSTLVEDEEWILRKIGPVTLERTGLIPTEGGIRLRDAVDAFLRFTDKPMIATRDAVAQGVGQACLDGVVGIGRGVSLATLQSRHCREAMTLDPNEEGVWIIPPFAPETKKQTPEETTGSEAGKGTTGSEKTSDTGGTTDQPMAGTGKRVARWVVSGNVPLENYAELFRCFVGPAARMGLKKLDIGLRLEMQAAPGKELDRNDPAIKSMEESARQLGLSLEILP